MTEKNSAGIKEAVVIALWAFALIAAYDLADTAMRLYSGGGQAAAAGWNMTLTVCAVAAGCVIVYFALTRCAASFTYEARGKDLLITRKIGHREKTVRIKYEHIVLFSRKRPVKPIKPIYKMRKTVFSNKNTYYLVYKSKSAQGTVVFEPSETLAAEITSKMKEGSYKWQK